MLNITFNSFTDQLQRAVMNTATSTKAYSDVDNAIKQVADAYNKGLDLNFLAAMIGVVVIVIVVFVYSGQQVVKGLITTPTGMVITLVVIYLIIAYFTKIFPFTQQKQEESDVIRLPCGTDTDCPDTVPICENSVCKDNAEGMW